MTDRLKPIARAMRDKSRTLGKSHALLGGMSEEEWLPLAQAAVEAMLGTGESMTDKPTVETALEHLKAFRGRYEHPANLCHLGLTTDDLDVIIDRLERTKDVVEVQQIDLSAMHKLTDVPR